MIKLEKGYKRLVMLVVVCLYVSVMTTMADSAKPWTFWYWMYGAVSEEGVKADLQAMKDVGLGGCYLMPIRGVADKPEYDGQAGQMSVNFWRMVDVALSEADRLGLDMGVHICDGFALAGGPWISPEESMQKVVWTDTIVVGGQRHMFNMRRPEDYKGYYEDIALYAVPLETVVEEVVETFGNSNDDSDNGGDLTFSTSIWQSGLLNAKAKGASYSSGVTINDKGVICADEPCWLQYAFDKPMLVRNIEIEPSGTNLQSQRLLVKASNDGVIFHTVKQLVPPRQGWQNTGFNTSFSIPPTEARYFRFEWTPEGTEPGAEDLDAAKWKPVLRIKSICLHAYPALDNWEGKAGYVWRIAPDTPSKDVPDYDFLRPADLVYGTVKGTDLVDMELPEGVWRILRMGHTSTGHTNATAGGAKGLECDKFSRRAVEKQIDNWFGLFMLRPNHRAIKFMHVDSWECGSQNWSKNFAQEFERRRGYDLMPLLPVYAGVPMRGGEETLRDIRRTINELVNEVFFVTVSQKAHEYGVLLSSESVAPTMVSDGMEHYKYVDVPMGEYWLNSPTHDKPNDMLDAISAAHVYGKRIIQAEGFTEVRGVWDETPASIKPLLDRNFCLGMNRLFFHVFTHNPWMDKKPGMTLDGIGLFFQRDQTWFAEAKGLVDYITRCQALLQQGQPVVDIAVYTGEEMPSRALTPDRVVPLLPGLAGPQRVSSEQQRKANIGVPMEESPVGVRHSANIIDLKDWVNPLHGYLYDSMNKDALMTQPFGYRVLVVPEDTKLTKEMRQRLAQLSGQGVLILHKPYTATTFGNLPPDAVLPEGIAFTHRHDNGRDIYFLANQTERVVNFAPTFRVSNMSGNVYYPVTDEYTPYQGQLMLRPHESVFVIFGSRPSNGQPLRSGRPAASVRNTQPLAINLDTWDVAFHESGVTMQGQHPSDWSQSTNDRIRYFSGHARYTTMVKLKEKEVPAQRTWLTLGDVRDIAHVWVNGKDCGLAWTAPYEVEITGTLQKGKNTIEIEVVNTWHNALRGIDQGKAPYEGIWTNAKYRTKGNHLLPAGLLTQPEIKIEQ